MHVSTLNVLYVFNLYSVTVFISHVMWHWNRSIILLCCNLELLSVVFATVLPVYNNRLTVRWRLRSEAALQDRKKEKVLVRQVVGKLPRFAYWKETKDANLYSKIITYTTCCKCPLQLASTLDKLLACLQPVCSSHYSCFYLSDLF